MWTKFMDMHSGGKLKEKWQYIYIEAPKREAERIFRNKFNHCPNHVTCNCCGEDYVIYENRTLRQATAFNRNCKWTKSKGYLEKQNTELKKYLRKSDFYWKKYLNENPSLKYKTLEQYKKNKDVLILYKKDFKRWQLNK